MKSITIQKIISLILILSPWFYIHNVFKDVLFIFLGIVLFLTTIDFRKKRGEQGFSQPYLNNNSDNIENK